MFCMANHCFYPAVELFSCSIQLINHVKNSIEKAASSCLKFSVLHMIYESRLHDLGITKDKEISKVNFKERVLNHFITQEQNDRKNVIATCF